MTTETLNIVITAVIVPLAAALIPLLIAYLNKKTQEIKQKVNNETVNKYIDIAEDAVETAVVSTYQTFVDALKKEGKFDEESARVAAETAKAKAIEIMGIAAKEALTELYGDFNTWLDSKLEYYVRLNKTV